MWAGSFSKATRVSHGGFLCLKRLHSVKPFYVSSPIFYVNSKPHLGHLYTMLLCDARHRWELLDSTKDSVFVTGTDEHGLKIQMAAKAQHLDPKPFVDQVSQHFKTLAEKLNIKYDRFIRTTDEDHVRAVQYFWELMMSRGLIYEGKHSGWYSISDETFYPENQIEEIEDAETKQKKMISKETRNQVFFQEETNYFFRLAQFQGELITFLEKNPKFIKPSVRYEELLKELKETKLCDLSVSRPSERLSWAIDVPNDPSQKIYVWFDALVNYLTAAGFPKTFFDEKGRLKITNSNPWPCTHVIGKDIIRFHCIYWPIFLIAAKIPLPDQVIVHSHWLSEGFKMSKSLGNVVDPLETYDYYGEDALRFFLMEYSNMTADSNFVEQSFIGTRESLVGKYANLVTRCGGNAFNIKHSIELSTSSAYDDIDTLIAKNTLISEEDRNSALSAKKRLLDDLNSLHSRMSSKIEDFDFAKAIRDWWSVIESANYFFQISQPWIYTKKLNDPATSESDAKIFTTLQSYSVYLVAETCRITSILIAPIIPQLATKILDRLAVAPEKRFSQFSYVGADASWGQNANSKTHKMPIERLPQRSISN